MAPSSFFSTRLMSATLHSPPALPFSLASLPRASSPRLSRERGLCRAAAEGESTTQTVSSDGPSGGLAPADGVPKKKTVIRRVKKPEPSEAAADANLELKSLEDPKVSVEGVVRLDKGGSFSLGQLLLLGAGDAAALVLFAWIGRATHVSSAVDFELLKTAFPFITGWLVSAAIFGEYSPSRSKPQGVARVAGSTAKTWAVGVPLGIAIRSILKGAPPAVPFTVVTLVSTAIILTAWRYAFFSLLGKDLEDSEATGDRKGNVFEFFELLTSLVRRW